MKTNPPKLQSLDLDKPKKTCTLTLWALSPNSTLLQHWWQRANSSHGDVWQAAAGAGDKACFMITMATAQSPAPLSSPLMGVRARSWYSAASIKIHSAAKTFIVWSSCGFTVFGSTWKQPRQLHLSCRPYLSVVVDLCFLLNVGVELWDIWHVAVRLFTVGVSMTVYRGNTDRQAQFNPNVETNGFSINNLSNLLVPLWLSLLTVVVHTHCSVLDWIIITAPRVFILALILVEPR